MSGGGREVAGKEWREGDEEGGSGRQNEGGKVGCGREGVMAGEGSCGPTGEALVLGGGSRKYRFCLLSSSNVIVPPSYCTLLISEEHNCRWCLTRQKTSYIC